MSSDLERLLYAHLILVKDEKRLEILNFSKIKFGDTLSTHTHTYKIMYVMCVYTYYLELLHNFSLWLQKFDYIILDVFI